MDEIANGFIYYVAFLFSATAHEAAHAWAAKMGDVARRYQQFLMTSPALGMAGMFVAWQVCDVVFEPIFWAAVNLLYPGVTYG